MKNKKAWVRIVESFLAILIILGAFLIIMYKNKPNINLENMDVASKQKQILYLISKNESLREMILTERYEDVNNAISQMIPPNWNFTINICKLNDLCNKETPNDREVYVSERIITSELRVRNYEPKKIKFFVWIK